MGPTGRQRGWALLSARTPLQVEIGRLGLGRARLPSPSGSRACRTRNLVAGDLAAAVCLHGVERGSAVRARLDDGDHARAPALVGHADHDRVEAVGVRLDRGFDLFGKDLLAARVDRHRAAPKQGDRAVRPERREVAGDRPALAALVDDEHLRRLRRVLVVADRHVAAARELADRAAPGDDRLEVLVEHRRVDRRPASKRRATVPARRAAAAAGVAAAAGAPTGGSSGPRARRLVHSGSVGSTNKTPSLMLPCPFCG